MKDKKNFHLLLSAVCFIIAFACALAYGISGDVTVRFFAAVGFAACSLVFLKMFFEFLKEIRFGKRLFAPLRKLLAKLYKTFTGKIFGKDDDRIYLESKKDEFQIKFETFRASPKQAKKKASARLPKYITLKTDKEKIRYIYTSFLKKKAERGYGVKPTLTPEEIRADFAGNERVELLFDAYPAARYGAENEPCEVDIDKLEGLM
jgi:hypothetical protein